MAAAEVRSVWHRTVNRCFVQEDAKRAPKLACCQSSCVTSKLDGVAPANAADESDHNVVNVTHFNQKFSISFQTHDARWWLNLQPHHRFKKGLAYEQLNALEDEVGILKASDENKTCKGDATHFGDEKHGSSDYMYYDFQAGIMKKTSMEGMQEAYSKNSQAFPELMDMMAKHEAMEIDSVGCLVSEQKKNFSLDSDYSWIEDVNAQPWWKTTDRDELACLVSQKLLNHIENCDLPPPRKKYLGGQPCANISNDNIKTECLDWEAKSSVFSNLTVQAKGSMDSGLMHRNLGPPSNKGNLSSASEKSSSYTTIHEGVAEQAFEGDHSKVQLMEALCHSQTRAREAEKLAKQAYAEKEHIIALFFIQASQLFAYRQWFRLLQLETLNTQIKNKDQPISTLLPEALSIEGRKPWKRKQKIAIAKQEKLGKPESDMSTYVVAFALGLSPVGAGLLLGWTVGWMLPRL